MEDTETVVVSRYGALLSLAEAPPVGSILEIKNRFSDQVEKFRVVWASETPHKGRYDVGVEILHPREEFWGIGFFTRART